MLNIFKRYGFILIISMCICIFSYCLNTQKAEVENDTDVINLISENTPTTENENINYDNDNDNDTIYELPSVWIGDSRTVGLSNYVNIDCIAEIGCGINYFWNNYDYIESLRGYNIYINLGVNDLYNIDNYIYTFNTMSDDFLNNNNIYIISVNPCNYDYTYLNCDIINFNYQLSISLDNRYKYIDTYNYLASYGFDTVDGLHYTEYTYYDIYNYVMNNKY